MADQSGQLDQSKWYVISVYSGFEKKVAQSILDQAHRKGLSDMIAEVLVPTEEVVELRRGVKVTVERNYYPGYVLVKMNLTDEAWHMVRDLPKVSQFLGAKGTKPLPISQREVDSILRQVQDASERPRHVMEFEVGEQVLVVDGPFSSFNAVVEDVDSEKTRLKVSVSIFGRPTTVDLEFSQVEKS